MRRGKRSVAVFFSVIFSVVLISVICAACGGGVNEDTLLKLEAETSSVTVIDPYLNAEHEVIPYSVKADSNSDNTTSGNSYIKNLSVGTQVVWMIEAESDIKTDLYIAVANGTELSGAFDAGNGKIFTMKLNGAELAVPAVRISNASAYLDNWQLIEIKGVSLTKGLNTVSLTITDDLRALHIDYLGVNNAKGKLDMHTHKWSNRTKVTETCTQSGSVERTCTAEGCGYKYEYSVTAAKGHDWSTWAIAKNQDGTYITDNDGATQLIRTCKNDAQHTETQKKPEGYFGMVVDKEEDLDGLVRNVKNTFEAEEAFVGAPGGLNSGSTPFESHVSASGGKLVANISQAGNYIKFDFMVSSEQAIKGDIALVMANVRVQNDSNILPLDPLSNFISVKLYNERYGAWQEEVDPDSLNTTGGYKHTRVPSNISTVKQTNQTNGAAFDYSLVNFPGQDGRDWYLWKYVVAQDVDLQPGLNTIVFRPTGAGGVTIPNTDALLFFTDKDCIVPVAGRKGMEVQMPDYVSQNPVKNAFEKVEGKNEFYLGAGQASTGEIIVEFTLQGAGNNLGNDLYLSFNGTRFNLIGLSVPAVSARPYSFMLSYKGLAYAAGGNRITYAYKNSGIIIDAVSMYTGSAIPVSYKASTEQSRVMQEKSQTSEIKYDAYYNTALTPSLTIEAEDAQLSYSKTGDRATVSTGYQSSGGKCIENYNDGGTGAYMTWSFKADKDCTVDIAIRMACSNWQSSNNGNNDMINLDSYFSLAVSGAAADLKGLNLLQFAGDDYHRWTMLVIEKVTIKAGQTYDVKMTAKSDKFPNVDVLYVYGNGGAAFEAVKK